MARFNNSTKNIPPQGGAYRVFVPEFPPPFRSSYQDLVGSTVPPSPDYNSSPSMSGQGFAKLTGKGYNDAKAFAQSGGMAVRLPNMQQQAIPYRSSFVVQNEPTAIGYNSVQAVGYAQAGMPNTGQMPFLDQNGSYVKENGMTTGSKSGGSRGGMMYQPFMVPEQMPKKQNKFRTMPVQRPVLGMGKQRGGDRATIVANALEKKRKADAENKIARDKERAELEAESNAPPSYSESKFDSAPPRESAPPPRHEDAPPSYEESKSHSSPPKDTSSPPAYQETKPVFKPRAKPAPYQRPAEPAPPKARWNGIINKALRALGQHKWADKAQEHGYGAKKGKGQIFQNQPDIRIAGKGKQSGGSLLDLVLQDM